MFFLPAVIGPLVPVAATTVLLDYPRKHVAGRAFTPRFCLTHGFLREMVIVTCLGGHFPEGSASPRLSVITTLGQTVEMCSPSLRVPLVSLGKLKKNLFRSFELISTSTHSWTGPRTLHTRFSSMDYVGYGPYVAFCCRDDVTRPRRCNDRCLLSSVKLSG